MFSKKNTIYIGSIFIICIIVLHNISISTEFDLDIITEKISFNLPKNDKGISLIQGVPLKAIALYGVSPISIKVKSFMLDKKELKPPKGQINIEFLPGKESHINFKNEDFRLMRLGFEGNSRVTIYSDNEYNIFIDINSAEATSIEIGMPDGKFDLLTHNAKVLGSQGERIIPINLESFQYSFKVVSLYHYLIFEQEEKKSFSVVLTFRDNYVGKTNLSSSSSITTYPRITAVDFNYEIDQKQVSAIHSLHIETPTDKKTIERKTFLKLQKADTFTLRGVFLDEKGLRCQLTGRVLSLEVGKEKPDQNLAPSLLEFLINNVIVKTIFQGWKGA